MEGKPLDATAAGQYVQKEMLEAKQKHGEEIEFLKSSMEGAIREKDETLLRTLREERDAAEARVNAAALEHRQLSITAEQLQSREGCRTTASRFVFGTQDPESQPLADRPLTSPLPSPIPWSSALNPPKNHDSSTHHSPNTLSNEEGPCTPMNSDPSSPPLPFLNGNNVDDSEPSTSLNGKSPSCEHEKDQYCEECEERLLQARLQDAEQEHDRLERIAIRQRPLIPPPNDSTNRQGRGPGFLQLKKMVDRFFGGDGGQQAGALVDGLAYGALEGGAMGLASAVAGMGKRR